MTPHTTDPLLTMTTLLKPSDVCHIGGFSLRTLNRMIRDGRFPRPIMFGNQIRRWRAEDVQSFFSVREDNHAEDVAQGGEDARIFSEVRAENIDRLNDAPGSPFLVIGTPPSPPAPPKMRPRRP